MSVLDRAALEDSPLADLHAIASELSIDGYRRLRKPELIDAILARPERRRRVTGRQVAEEPTEQDDAAARSCRRRGAGRAVADELGGRRGREASAAGASRRGGRGRAGARDDDQAEESARAEQARAADGDARSDRSRGEREDRGERGEREERRPRAREPRSAANEPRLRRRSRAWSSCCPTARASCASSPPRALRRRRLHLGRAGQALRAGVRRPGRRTPPPAAALRAVRVAGPDRHDQRPAGRRSSPTGARFDDLPAAFPSERFRSAPRIRRSRRSSG